jgi:hypothetical protein
LLLNDSFSFLQSFSFFKARVNFTGAMNKEERMKIVRMPAMKMFFMS